MDINPNNILLETKSQAEENLFLVRIQEPSVHIVSFQPLLSSVCLHVGASSAVHLTH